MEITLTKWTRPGSYSGPEYPEHYYVDGLDRHRDSDDLAESNHAVALRTLRAIEDETPAGWQVIRDSHWAVGWIEYILIHESRKDLLEAAQVLVNRKADYPALDEDDWSAREMETAKVIWRNGYNAKERAKYIRDHRSQFDFHSWGDLRAQVRGEYFSGYVAELIHE